MSVLGVVRVGFNLLSPRVLLLTIVSYDDTILKTRDTKEKKKL